VLFAAAYGVVVLANFSSLITAVNMSSDNAVAPVIGKLLGSAPHGSQVLLGNHPWYEELWFLRATSGLPGYRQLWDIVPVASSLLGLALLAWSTWKALGAQAAALAASALLCVGAGAREFFFTFDSHGITAVHTILLGVFLVWLVGWAERLRDWQLALAALVAGTVSAAPATGDKLFLYWALLPMLAAAALLVWRTRSRVYWRVLAVTVGVAAIALGGGALLRHAMHDQGWLGIEKTITFVAPATLVPNLVLLVQSYLFLGGGEFFGQSPNFVGTTVFLTGALLLVTVIALLFELRRRSVNAAPAPVPADRAGAQRFVYVTFWASSLLVTSVVYVFTNAPADVFTSRYLLAGYIAIGALLPLLALRSRGWQASVAAGICLFALIASYQVVRKPFAPANEAFPGPREANALVRIARAEHVSYGYAGYWDAADLTWLSHFKLDLYPVDQCAPSSPKLCRFNLGNISSWYVPRPHTRSLLIVDTRQPQLVSAPDPAFGKPLLASTIGALQVYIYPYDIASHI
jgi:hypothetical protein